MGDVRPAETDNGESLPSLLRLWLCSVVVDRGATIDSRNISWSIAVANEQANSRNEIEKIDIPLIEKLIKKHKSHRSACDFDTAFIKNMKKLGKTE